MTDYQMEAYEGSESYIFISYAHRDSDKVMPILRRLRESGCRVWYDEGIAPGSEWPEDIARHLDGSAMVIAFVTPNSMASANCRREINFALSREKPFLSVVLEPTEMPLGMELQLSAQQSVIRQNFHSEEKFLDRICTCPGVLRCRTQAREIPAAPAAEAPKPRPAAEAPKPQPSPVSAAKPRSRGLVIGIAVALAVLAGALVLILTAGPKEGPYTQVQTAQTEETITVRAQVPEGWGATYCWAWYEDGDVFDQWPGALMGREVGWYALELPAYVTGIVLSCGDAKSGDVVVEPGRDVWIVEQDGWWIGFYQEPTDEDIRQAFAGIGG